MIVIITSAESPLDIDLPKDCKNDRSCVARIYRFPQPLHQTWSEISNLPLTYLYIVAGPQRLSLVTTSRFNVLESAVNDLKGVVYGMTPTNEQIMEDVRLAFSTNLR